MLRRPATDDCERKLLCLAIQVNDASRHAGIVLHRRKRPGSPAQKLLPQLINALQALFLVNYALPQIGILEFDAHGQRDIGPALGSRDSMTVT